MKRLLFLLVFCALTFAGTTAIAQDKSAQERRERVESAKIAFLTDKMSLTTEQAQKFWPLYNEYEAKRRALLKSYRSGYRQNVEEPVSIIASSFVSAAFSRWHKRRNPPPTPVRSRSSRVRS